MFRITGGWVALVVALATLNVSPAAAAADPVRVLLTGDSITHGRHGDYTWRYRLAKEFQRQHVPFDFVGSASTPYQDPGFGPSTYADPNFDRNHFARAGWQLRYMAPQIAAEVAEQRPDVIVLAAGINDLLHGQSVDELEASLRSWITQARKGRSVVRIVISPLLAEAKVDAALINAQVTDYDTRLPGLAADLSTLLSPITVAQTNQGWTPTTTTTWDGLHPTPTGETFIAQRIAEALQQIDVLASAPAIYRPVAWPLTQHPAVTLAGSTATVTWSRQAVSAALIRLQRVGGALLAPATPYRGGSAGFALVPGATYDVSLQSIRGTMSGPWGPATRIRVPVPPRPAAPARVAVTSTGVRWSASATARSYVVKFRKVGTEHWQRRETKALKLSVPKIRVAKVRAVSAGGKSGWKQNSAGK